MLIPSEVEGVPDNGGEEGVYLGGGTGRKLMLKASRAWDGGIKPIPSLVEEGEGVGTACG